MHIADPTEEELDFARKMRARAVENAFVSAAQALADGHLHDAQRLASVAEILARVAKASGALETPAPAAAPDFPLVKYDHGQGLGWRDQATLQMNIGAAKASLSRLIEAALNGDIVVLCRAGHPVARIVPYDYPMPPSQGQATLPASEALALPLNAR